MTHIQINHATYQAKVKTMSVEALRFTIADARAAIVAMPPAELPTNLRATLRPYQKEGFQFLAHLSAHGFGGVAADLDGIEAEVGVLPAVDLLLGVGEVGREFRDLVNAHLGEVAEDELGVLAAELDDGIGGTECGVVADEDARTEGGGASKAEAMRVPQTEDVAEVAGGGLAVELEDTEVVLAGLAHQAVLLTGHGVAVVGEGIEDVVEEDTVRDWVVGCGGGRRHHVGDVGERGGVTAGVKHKSVHCLLSPKGSLGNQIRCPFLQAEMAIASTRAHGPSRRMSKSNESGLSRITERR